MSLHIPPNLSVFFGPPGTGKTYTLSLLVNRMCRAEGADSLLLCSYTKAGAEQLAQQDFPTQSLRIGTLHSHCYHGMDKPRIAETLVKQWNEAYPRAQMSPPETIAGLGADDAARLLCPGDKLLAELNYCRSCCLPRAKWLRHVLDFAACWEDWKRQHHALDFTDLIEQAIQLLPVAPGNPATIILDEAQDFSALQWQLITRWGTHARRVIAGGDDDQCLYRWNGATSRPLMQAQHKQTLQHSYRVPARIYDYVHQRYLYAIRLREHKTWYPAARQGLVDFSPMIRRRAMLVLPYVERIFQTTPSRTLAILATCGYMLTPFLHVLRDAGIPFCNPWRPSAAAWNPLHHTRQSKSPSVVERLLAFLKPPSRLWTWRELVQWTGLLRQEVLPRLTTQHLLTQQDHDTPCTQDTLEALIPQQVRDAALRQDTRWLSTHSQPHYARALQYPLRVLRRYSRDALVLPPSVFVGTCHSLKGGEADDVILLTKLSHRAKAALAAGGDAADDVYRMLYVGATRAKERLFVC